ncbi:MAG TPA: hypothetical protein VNI78_00170 [Vicinamibacterales bacterium]|nr:hypothetical protein [Vicinamibacterales bacterium]
MRTRSALVLVVVAAILSLARGSVAEDRLRIDVTPRISQAPAQVRIRARVTPNAENRALRVVADSGDFFRSSLLMLDGADAALVNEMSFKNLPGGEYEVTVTLLDAEGHATTVDRRTITVMEGGR